MIFICVVEIKNNNIYLTILLIYLTILIILQQYVFIYSNLTGDPYRAHCSRVPHISARTSVFRRISMVLLYIL